MINLNPEKCIAITVMCLTFDENHKFPRLFILVMFSVSLHPRDLEASKQPVVSSKNIIQHTQT